jgi:hypothetical protein
MYHVDFITIVKYAWIAYDPSREIKSVSDISAKVSTNHVYKIVFTNNDFVIAKMSYFGKYEHFVEDHTIINVLANNLPAPFENFLARSLIRQNELFVHRIKNSVIDAWVVFYRPMTIEKMLPRRLDYTHIDTLGEEFGRFHKTCYDVKNTLPPSSKTLYSDIQHLLEILETPDGKYEHRGKIDTIKQHSDLFFEHTEKLKLRHLEKIPVFVDWNIGNFSVTAHHKLFSRWDYDWFRMSSRMLDFYFLSRIVSSIGDRTVFSYNIETLMEERFLFFLKHYHAVYPLQESEIRLLPEIYRFFILNYVIKDGRYFFHEIYATKLQREAYEIYLPSVESFQAERILDYLGI